MSTFTKVIITILSIKYGAGIIKQENGQYYAYSYNRTYLGSFSNFSEARKTIVEAFGKEYEL